MAPKAWELGSNLAKLFVGLALPGMVEKAIQYGREEKNFRDRQLILQSGGVAPTPHRATINVNQNNAQWNAGHSTLADFSQDTIELVAAIRDNAPQGQIDVKLEKVESTED